MGQAYLQHCQQHAKWFAVGMFMRHSFLNSTLPLMPSTSAFLKVWIDMVTARLLASSRPGEHQSVTASHSLQGLGTQPANKGSSSPLVFVTMVNYGKILVQLKGGPPAPKSRNTNKNLVAVKWIKYLLVSLGIVSLLEIKSCYAAHADSKVLSSGNPVSQPSESLGVQAIDLHPVMPTF